MEDVNYHLGEDYLRAAKNFIFLAEQACIQIPPKSVERALIVEDPLTFLISHAAELTLKAILAFEGYGEETLIKPALRHNLRALCKACQGKKVVLNDRFLYWVECIADNHEKYDNRYPRTFAGFPAHDHERLLELIREPDDEKGLRKKELRKYGLVAKTTINAENFIQAVKDQIEVIIA